LNAQASSAWQYGLRCDGIEQAIWSGDFSRPLSWHFHPEIQISAVLSGRRRFLTASGAVAVNAGEILIVPPGLPHQALGIETGQTLSFNLYLRSAAVSLRKDAIVVPTPRWFGTAIAGGSPAMSNWANDMLMRSHACEFERASEAIATVLAGDHLSIGGVASSRGMSREGFIRWFRRHVGMTPHAYRLADRLNRARALLAADATPAQAAAEAGFADQSHMGRNFRLAFGATPGAYRCALRG
jgi:AraC-like DNA-binding protein